MTELFTDLVVQERTMSSLLGQSQNSFGLEGQNPSTVGGLLIGSSYKTSDGGARMEIFPQWDPTIALIVYNSAGTSIFKVEIDGTNTGDITMGDYAGSQGLFWDQSAGTFTVKGAITIVSGSVPWSTVSGTGKPADNATVGADWTTNLANIPATLGTVGAAGLYLSATYMGFYSGAAWTAYIDNSGNFYFKGDANSSIDWNITTAGTLTVKGKIVAGTGSSVSTAYLDGVIPQANLNIADRGWSQTCAFSVTDADTIAWGAGTFTSADGTAYSIDAGSTGNMVAKTYIYLDIAVSETAYQVTTTATTAVGVGKVLIAIAQNATAEATYQTMQGQGGLNIDAANIVAGSITANEIAATTITAAKMSITSLSSIVADMGSITAGTITLSTAGYIKGGQTAYATGTGFFLGYSTSAYKFSIDNGDNYIHADGSNIAIKGTLNLIGTLQLKSYTTAALPAGYSGFLSPTGVGAGTFTNAIKAYTSNDDWATAVEDNTQIYTTFGLSIPVNATISGIEVNIESHGDVADQEVRVYLSWNVGDAPPTWTAYKTLTPANTTDSVQTLGSSSDDWDKAGGWVYQEFSNTNFGVKLLLNSDGTGGTTFSLDNLQVKVHYVDPLSPFSTGSLAYNSTDAKFTGHNGTAWKSIAWYDDLSGFTSEMSYPSATLQLSSDAEASSGAGGGAYIKVKELTSTVTGAIKTMFEIKKTGDLQPTSLIAGKIYVNGVAAGEEHQTNNTDSDGYEVFTDAYIDVTDGDLVQVYMKSIDSMYDGKCQNFRLYWDISTKEFINASDDVVRSSAATIFKTGTATRDMTAAAGTQNIAHGLGIVPKFVKLSVTCLGRTAARFMVCIGSYNGTVNACAYSGETGSADVITGTSDTYGIYLQQNDTGSDDYQRAIITWDATNIILTWTKDGTPAETARIIWEAYA